MKIEDTSIERIEYTGTISHFLIVFQYYNEDSFNVIYEATDKSEYYTFTLDGSDFERLGTYNYSMYGQNSDSNENPENATFIQSDYLIVKEN